MKNKKEIIEQNGIRYEVVRIIETKPDKKVIIGPGWDVTEFEEWYDKEYCLKAVKQNGDSLRYVKDQTAEICLAAVKQNGDSLQFVKDQSAEICLAAVKQNGHSLQFVNKKVFNNKKKKIKDEQAASV